MNTARSSVLGWGALVVAAGASYYWARQGIDERRKQQATTGARSTEKLDWRARIERDATSNAPAPGTAATPTDPSSAESGVSPVDSVSSTVPGASSPAKAGPS